MKKTLRFIAVAMVAVIVCLALASCGGPNSNPDKALESLKKNGVTFAAKDTVFIPRALKAFGVEGVTDAVSGTGFIKEKAAHITIIYFESAAAANNAFEGVEKYSNTIKNDDLKDNWVFEKSGKMIYFGTPEAIKAAG